ncbi:MAG: glycyl-radical enzyme activating protein [Hyphomicrobiales bacterium]
MDYCEPSVPSLTACIFNIQKHSVHDGPGIRQTVFFKGCPLSCWWCHNPESQSESIDTYMCEKYFDDKTIATRKVIGKHYSIEELMIELRKDILLYEESNGGVTFSGGEPLMQLAFLKEILIQCKKENIHTAIDTSGYCPENYLEEIMPFTDLFLYDLKTTNSYIHKKHTGVSNDIILKNLKFLDENNANIEIRIPIIPDINTDTNTINDIIKLISKLKTKPEISLLPFHLLGKEKFKLINKEYKASVFQEPSNELLQSIVKQFSDNKLEVNLH